MSNTTKENEAESSNKTHLHRVMLDKSTWVVLAIPETMTPAQFNALLQKSRRIFRLSDEAELPSDAESEDLSQVKKRGATADYANLSRPVQVDAQTGQKWRLFPPKAVSYLLGLADQNLNPTEVVSAFREKESEFSLPAPISDSTLKRKYISLKSQSRLGR